MPASRNYASYTSNIEYSLKSSDRYDSGQTFFTAEIEYTNATSGSTSGEDDEGTFVNTDATESNSLNDFTSFVDDSTEHGAIDGLTSASTSAFTSIEGETVTEMTRTIITRNGQYSGGETSQHSVSEDAFYITTTYSQTDNSFSFETNDNPTFTASRSGRFKHDFTTFGAVTNSSTVLNVTDSDSNNTVADEAFTDVVSYQYATASAKNEGAGGSSRETLSTSTSSKEFVNYTSVNFAEAPLIQFSGLTTSAAYSVGETDYSGSTTTITSSIRQGGNSSSSTIVAIEKSGSGFTNKTFGPEDETGFVTEGGETNTGTTSTFEDSGPPESDLTGSGSTSTSSIFIIPSVSTDVLTTYTFEDTGSVTTTTSTEVSKAFGLPSSLSITDTMRTFTLESTSLTRSSEIYSRTSTKQTVDIVTSPYDYEVFEFKEIVYEGGWGVYGFTETQTLGDSIAFSTIEKDSLSTKVTIPPNELKPLGSQSIQNTVTHTTETNSEEIVFSAPTSSTTPTRQTTLRNNTIDPATFFTINTDSPTGSGFRNHNFYDSTGTTFDTTTGSASLFIKESDVTDLIGADFTTTNITKTSFDRDATLLTRSFRFTTIHTTFETFWDGTSVDSITGNVLFDGESFTAKAVRRIGIPSHTVKKTLTSKILETNVISSVFPSASLVTFESLHLGINFISDTTTKLSERKPCKPASVDYTYNYLTTSKKEIGSREYSYHVSSTKTAESYAIPGALMSNIQGLAYLIKDVRDEGMTIYDRRGNSVTYDNSGGLSLESIAEFSGTFTTVSTLLGETATAKDTYTGTKKFYTLFENTRGATPINDTTITIEDRTIHGFTYDSNGNITTNTNSTQFYFGGRKHYNSAGVMFFNNQNQFTLVDANDTDSTTLVEGDLNKFYEADSTELDANKRYFISTNTVFMVGTSDDVRGQAINTYIYIRNTYENPYDF